VTSRRVRRSAQQWQALIEAQPSSSLGVADYCAAKTRREVGSDMAASVDL
jgi:hypothetical protein